MADRTNIFLKKSFVAITGASRGLGRYIALHFSTKFPCNSVIVLMARNKEALECVKTEVLSVAPDVNVLMRCYDQGHLENTNYFKNIFNELLLDNNLSQDDFEQSIIVHNCATIGDVSKGSLELSESILVRKYFDINLTGMILLNTSFFQTFSDSTKFRVIVNITSSSSYDPLASFHLYSAGKAARDMFMRVLAVEEPSLRILTFSPGAVDTDMANEVETLCVNKSFVERVKGLRADGKMKHPDIPISTLVQILEENTFENAAYVDCNYA